MVEMPSFTILIKTTSFTIPPMAVSLTNKPEHKINNMDELTLSSQQLMVSALTKMGCQPTVDEVGSVAVTYQGECFNIDFGGRYAQVWDLDWAYANINAPDFGNVIMAVNLANYNLGPTVVMSRSDENGMMSLHSRLSLLMHPAITEIVEYVRCSLDAFFRAKELVYRHIDQINLELQQKAIREKRRPVGFSATPAPTENPE